MPIYEYECDKCGDHLEVLQKITDKPLTRCSKCRGKVRKVVSRSSFQLKGSGWYLTDYSRKGTSTSSKDSSTSSKDSGTESTSTSKTAAASCTPSGCDSCD